MKRYAMKHSKSKKLFRHTAGKTHSRNIFSGSMRGGIRL